MNWDATEDQEWTFEKKTSPGWGQGDYVISKKRKSFGLYEADRLADDMQPLMEDLADLKAEMAVLKGIGLSSGSAVVNMAWGVGALVGAVMLSLY